MTRYAGPASLAETAYGFVAHSVGHDAQDTGIYVLEQRKGACGFSDHDPIAQSLISPAGSS